MMTGVHRKDVTRLLSEGDQKPSEPRGFLWKVLSCWENDPQFVTKRGKPRILTCSGAQSEFTQLVSRVSREVNPYTVLFELERVGAVERTVTGVRLRESTYIPAAGDSEGLRYLSTDIDDLVFSVEENIYGSEPGINHHIKTQFDAIPTSAVAELRQWINELGAQFHRSLRSHLSALEKNATAAEAEEVVRVAVFSASRIDFTPGDPFHVE